MIGMKFAVRQNVVEQALKEHFAQQITMPEGSDLYIQFAATRGDGGITANIEVVPEGFEPPVRAAKSTATTTATGAPRKKPGPKPKAAAAKAVAEGTGNQPAVTEDSVHVSDELREAAQSNDPDISVQEARRLATGDVETPAEEETAAPAQETRGSLFGGLTRPNNAG